jgi:predicted HTH domain antitoxin
MEATSLKEIANELSIPKSLEEREQFLGVVGALAMRRISLAKAAEIMNMKRDTFLGLLDAVGVDFSYLTKDDIEEEKAWPW